MNNIKREVTIIPGNGMYGQADKSHRQLRVASYSRVSTDSEEQLTSFVSQKSYYTEMILKNPKWTLANTYADEGISGATAEKRPDFMKMIRHCKKGKIDLIITKSISRFARNTLDSIGYVRKLKAMGVGVIFEKENINTLEENSEVVLTILSSLAQEELNSLSLNVKMGKRMAMQEGKVYYQYDNFYGYKKGESGEPEIIAEEAKIVKRIFQAYISGGTTRTITEDLNRKNIKYRKNKKWGIHTIRSILINEKYCGDVILQKTYVTDPITKKSKKNNGELPKVYIKNNHIGIISREIFEKTQEENARRSSKKKTSKTALTENGKYSRMYALSEILICGHCGTPYKRYRWTKHSGEKYAVWRCINRVDYGTKYCDKSITIDEESLHKAIMTAILAGYKNSKVIPLELTSELRLVMRNKRNPKVDIDLMEKQISDLINETMEIFMRSIDIEDEYEKIQLEKKMQSLSDESKKLQNIVDEHKAKNKSEDEIDEKIEEINTYLKSEPSDLYEYDDTLVRQIIDTIKVISADKIKVYFKNGTEYEQSMSLKIKSKID
ncbi:MAG: recombinase family protein [Clostridia bacterium]